MATAQFSRDEGVELAHAVVAEVAARHDIRALFIKGVSLERHGLRARRVAADVDVLVAPADLPVLLAGLVAVGWHERRALNLPRVMPMHAVTVVNETWPCDIDLHHYFPGIFADPAAAFAWMWESRTTTEVAGVTIAIPSRAVAACIAALHYTRTPSKDRSMVEMPNLVERVRQTFGPQELAMLDEAVRRLRSREALEHFLVEVGVADAPRDLTDQERRLWRQRIVSDDSTTSMLLAIGRLPLHQRVRALWDAVFFVDIAQLGPGQVSAFARMREWVRRLGRGARALPSALAIFLQERRAARRRA